MSDRESTALGLEMTKAVAQRIVVRDLVLACSIGVSAEERQRRQRLRIGFELELEANPPRHDGIDETVNYGILVKRAREICQTCDCRLLETLAERLACDFFLEPRVQYSRIRIEKLDRYADVGGVGIEIERKRKTPSTADAN